MAPLGRVKPLFVEPLHKSSQYVYRIGTVPTTAVPALDTIRFLGILIPASSKSIRIRYSPAGSQNQENSFKDFSTASQRWSKRRTPSLLF